MSEEIKLRWYQKESAEKLVRAVVDRNTHPIAAIPTAGGKSFIICETINLYLSEKPFSNVLVLSHNQEILEQNYSDLVWYFEGIEIGLYSAGLESRTIEKITVAGIQSIHNKPELFSGFDLVLIDECHLIPFEENTMYRRFLGAIEANYMGVTATPYRLKGGYLHEGDNALFNDLVIDLTSGDNFNRLVREGYLSELVTKNTSEKFDADKEKVRTTAGDYNNKGLSQAFDRKSITNNAVDEIIQYGKIYKHWLVFAIDIQHAEHIAENFREKGISAICIHSKMEHDRKQTIRDIKAGKYKAIVNVDILTTGFNFKQIDLIAMLRPTKSPVLHVQSIGRGLRVAEGKERCLILDFAGNTQRIGPINDIQIDTEKKSKRKGKQILKECPECLVLNYPSVRFCEVCAHEFEFEEKLTTKASNAEIVTTETKEQKPVQHWVDVKSVSYSIHQKKGSPSSLRVTYVCGLQSFSEWICYDHKSYAGYRAKNWVKFRWPKTELMPENVGALLKNSVKLSEPRRIKIDTSSKYTEIIEYDFTLQKKAV